MSSFLSRMLQRPSAAPSSAVAATSSPIIDAAKPTGGVGDFLFEEQVSAAKLLSLFRQAFMQVEAVDDARLRVVSDNGLVMHVVVDEDRKMIMFSACFGLKPDEPVEAKLAFVNRVNDRVIFVRFAVHDDTTLSSDVHLLYEGGVASASVMAATRRFARVTQQSIHGLDSERVVA